MTTIPPIVPPLPVQSPYARDLPAGAAFGWLRAGWRDLTIDPATSLAYGLLVLLLSAAIIGGFLFVGWDYIIFPALAGFLVFAPTLAIGLYAKSRALELGERPALREVVLPRPASGGQVMFTGIVLCGLMLLWMRAAVLIYALFFGVKPFPGLNHIVEMLFSTPTGAAMLVVGSAVGALFAAFSFAISGPESRCADGNGDQLGTGSQQSRTDAGLGRGGVGVVPLLASNGAVGPAAGVPAARARHLARL
jgi:uncharacterized membrane protein